MHALLETADKEICVMMAQLTLMSCCGDEHTHCASQ